MCRNTYRPREECVETRMHVFS